MGLKKVYVTSDGSYRDDDSWDWEYLSGHIPISEFGRSHILFDGYDDYSFSKLPIISILKKLYLKKRNSNLLI